MFALRGSPSNERDMALNSRVPARWSRQSPAVMSLQPDGGHTAQPPGEAPGLPSSVIDGTAPDPTVSSPGPAPHSPSALGRGACTPLRNGALMKRVRGSGQRARHGGSWVPCLGRGDRWPLISSAEPRLRWGAEEGAPHPSPSDMLQQPGGSGGS